MIFKQAILIIHGFAGGTYDQEELAFNLELNKSFDVFQFTLPGHDKALSKVNYQEWIKCREYEYYTKHRNVLIEAGPDAVTENMMISQIRYAVMAKQLCEYNKDRKAMFLANQQSCDAEDNISI